MNVKNNILIIGTIGLVLGGLLRQVDYGGLQSHFVQRLRKESSQAITSRIMRIARPSVRPISAIHRAAGDNILRTGYPTMRTPNWGAMRDKAGWSRSYKEMPSSEFVAAPEYDLSVLTFPMKALDPDKLEDIPLITAKLYYSTRFFGSYNIDAGEFTGPHAGIDLKLPKGTPVAAIAEGSVHAVSRDDRLGLFVILEHRHPTEGALFSIYGHLDTARVAEGARVRVGEDIGTVGVSGYTSGPHLHLQVDRPKQSGGQHVPFITHVTPSSRASTLWTLNPIRFIEQEDL